MKTLGTQSIPSQPTQPKKITLACYACLFFFPYHLGEACCPLSLLNANKFLGSLSFGTYKINHNLQLSSIIKTNIPQARKSLL